MGAMGLPPGMMQGGNMPTGANGAPMAPNAMRPMGTGPQMTPGMTRGVPAAGAGMGGLGNAAPTMGTQPVQSAQPTVDPRRLAAVLGSMAPQRR